MNIALVEPRAVCLSDIGETMFRAVEGGVGCNNPISASNDRYNYPIQAQAAIAAYLRKVLGDSHQISIHNFKYRDPKKRLGLSGPGSVSFGQPVDCVLYETYHRVLIDAPDILQVSFGGVKDDEIRDQLADKDVIFITANFTQEAESVKNIAEIARSINSRVIIVVGGTDASSHPEFYSQFANTVVLGEAEGLTEEQLREIFSGKAAKVIDGHATANMDEIPFPALDLVDLKWFSMSHDNPIYQFTNAGAGNPIIGIHTSRGCPRRCNFCTAHLRGIYRTMSVERFGQYLDYLKTFGIQNLSWDEDAVLARMLPNPQNQAQKEKRAEGRKKLMEMMAMLRQKGFRWEWPNGLDFNNLWNHETNIPDIELIEALYGEPCMSAMLPVETTVPTERDKLKKLTSWEQTLQILTAIKDATNALLKFTLIIGGPNETLDTLKITEERARIIQEILKKSPHDYVEAYVLLLQLLPKTQNYDDYQHLLTGPYETHSPLCTYKRSMVNGLYLPAREKTRHRERLDRTLNADD